MPPLKIELINVAQEYSDASEKVRKITDTKIRTQKIIQLQKTRNYILFANEQVHSEEGIKQLILIIETF